MRTAAPLSKELARISGRTEQVSGLDTAPVLMGCRDRCLRPALSIGMQFTLDGESFELTPELVRLSDRGTYSRGRAVPSLVPGHFQYLRWSARPAGFEPAAKCLEGTCSIH